MADYLLDTSFLIDLLNSKDEALEIHEEISGSQATSTVCVYELSKFDGFDRSKLEVNRVFGLSPDDAAEAGEVYRRLKERGEPVGETDCLISGAALSRDLTLVTRDEDFRKIEALDAIFY